MATFVSIGIGSHRLAPAAAASYARAVAAGAPPQMTSSVRDHAHQAYLRDGWEKRLPGFNFALRPEDSKHVAGLAIDVPGEAHDTKTAKGWFTKYGKDYGWYPVDNEDWHFEYREHLDTKKPKPRPTITREEVEMFITRKGKSVYVLVTGSKATNISKQAAEVLRDQAGVPIISLPIDDVTAIQRAMGVRDLNN